MSKISIPIQDQVTGKMLGSIGAGKDNVPIVPSPGFPRTKPDVATDDTVKLAHERFQNGKQEIPADDVGGHAPPKPTPDFDDLYEAMQDADGSLYFASYEAAISAADNNPNRVWTIVDGDYNDGPKIWKFDFNGDTQIVASEDEIAARDLAATLYNEQYGDTENPIEPEDIEIEQVSTSNQDDIFDETFWIPVASSYATAGYHFVNAIGYSASTKPRTDSNETLAWC